MGFQVAEADLNNQMDSGTIQTLSPGPTTTQYPTRFEHSVRTTVDGAAVVQAPLADGRVRSWVWNNYRITTPGYLALYNLLLNLQYSLRLDATPAKSPYAYLKEDVTDNLAKLTWNSGESKFEHTNDWVRVKVVNVTQDVTGSGPVKYGTMKMDFIIDDSSWNTF